MPNFQNPRRKILEEFTKRIEINILEGTAGEIPEWFPRGILKEIPGENQGEIFEQFLEGPMKFLEEFL